MPAAHLLGKPHRRRYVLRSPGDALGRSQLLKPLKPQVGPTFSVGIWSCCSSQLLPFVDFFFKQQKEKIDTEEYQFLILGRIPVFVEVTFQVSVTHGPGKVGSSPRSPAGSLLVTGHSGKGPGASRLAGSLERGGH